MQIRTRLTLRFTLIVLAILAVFSLSVYYFSLVDQRNEVYQRLKSKALNTARLYSKDVKEIDTTLLKIIDKNSVGVLQRTQVIVYDENGQDVYRSPEGKKGPDITVENKNRIKEKREIFYKKDKKQFALLYYDGKLEKLYVIASAFDSYGAKSLNLLLEILVIGFFISAIITAFTGYYYAKQALLPISKVISRVEDISASNLNLRLDTGNGTDEISHLAITFNRMLNRLEDAFEMQKNFVANASHELRTPLTAITGQIEVSLMNIRQPEEYRQVLSSVLEDVKNLNQLANGLLELIQASLERGEIKFQPVRIDEMLLQAKKELLKRKPDYSVDFSLLKFPEKETGLRVNGHPLLKAALINIMDNACKYSPDHGVQISFHFNPANTQIIFTDHGMGIPKDEVNNIFLPFQRAANAKQFSGYGLGLAITQKIIEQHKGTIIVESEVNKFTTVIVELPVITP